MSFLSLIARNFVRQRTRTLLTVLGIGIGITTVVVLGSITQGMKATSEDLLRSGGADFMVAQKGAADLSFSTISLRDWRAVEREPGIERAWGVLMHVSRAGSRRSRSRCGSWARAAGGAPGSRSPRSQALLSPPTGARRSPQGS